jgi:hypothetical protein
MEIYLIPIANAQTINGIVSRITDILNLIIPIIFAIATIVFFWGIVLFITSGGDEEKRKEGRAYIIYGLIGLFVMVAVWGIVNVFIGFFFPSGVPRTVDVPNIPGFGGGSNNSPLNPCASPGQPGCE